MSADTVQALIEAGVTGPALVRVIRSIDADMEKQARISDPMAEKRRAWDRERKRLAARNVSTGIPPDISTGITEIPPEIPPEKSLENGASHTYTHAVAAVFEEIEVKEEKKDRIAEEAIVDEPDGPEKIDRAASAEKTALVRWVAETWNAMADSCGLPQVAEIHNGRRASILARSEDLIGIHDFSDHATGFNALFNKIRGSPFLRGERADRDGRAFRCTLDFAIKKSSFTNIMEGKYEDRPKGRQ